MHFAPDYINQAEDAYAESLERKESRLSNAYAALVDEFIDAAKLPLLTTVHAPTDRQPFRRSVYLDEFFEHLTPSMSARVIAVVAKHDAELVKELAKKFAGFYAEWVQ